MSAERRAGPNPAIASRRLALIRVAAVLTICTASAAFREDRQADSTPLPRLQVNANSVPTGVLESLPRIGPALAGRIVEAREQSPFSSLDDLDRRVRGVGPATVAGLRPYLRFD
jgi:DNA uptake protein ComE-like DNA-binding protein